MVYVGRNLDAYPESRAKVLRKKVQNLLDGEDIGYTADQIAASYSVLITYNIKQGLTVASKKPHCFVFSTCYSIPTVISSIAIKKRIYQRIFTVAKF